jgi:hypothetical protein
MVRAQYLRNQIFIPDKLWLLVDKKREEAMNNPQHSDLPHKGEL